MPVAFGIGDPVMSAISGVGEAGARMLRTEKYGEDYWLSPNTHFPLFSWKWSPEFLARSITMQSKDCFASLCENCIQLCDRILVKEM